MPKKHGMERFALLKELDGVITDLEGSGRLTEAIALHRVFMRVAQSPRKVRRKITRQPAWKTPINWLGMGAMGAAAFVGQQFFDAASQPSLYKQPSAIQAPAPPPPGDFGKFERFTLDSEGGYTHRSKKDDPGGATNFGVTQKTYNDYRDSLGLKRRHVRQIEQEEVQDIMQTMYWDEVRGGELPERTAVALADMSYLQGPTSAIKHLQKLLGMSPDGLLGDGTFEAVWNYAETPEKDLELALKLTSLREEYLKSLPHAKANPGWFNRTDRMEEYVADATVFPSGSNEPRTDSTNGEV